MIPQEDVREVLVRLTDRVDNEQLADILFAVGLIVTDHVYNINRRLNK